MPIYRYTIELEIDEPDISCVNDTLESIRNCKSITIVGAAPHSDNPPEYPQDDE